MPLRVAFDLDGTIADMRVVLRKEAEQLFRPQERPGAVLEEAPSGDSGDEPDSTRVMSELHLTDQQQMQLWDHVKRIENFWVGLPETEPGIVAKIAQTAAARRWDVIFLTTRPRVKGDTTQVQTQRWLASHGFALPSVFVVKRSRGRIADALELDTVVDDRPENAIDVAADSQAKAILIWPGEPRGLPPGTRRLVQVVPTISDALAAVIKLDDVKNDHGVTRSIKRWFGRETPV